MLLITSLFISCKSRKLTLDQSKTVDKTEINQTATVAEKTIVNKTDNTITHVTVDSTAGTKVTEEYHFTPALKQDSTGAVNTPPGSLPMSRLDGYKKTTETFGSKKTQKDQNNNIGETKVASKDSTGITDTHKNITDSEKKKTLDAVKSSNSWVWGLVGIILALCLLLFIWKKK